MNAPQNIQDVLRGPHVLTLVRDADTAVVVAEPLRFIPLQQIVGYCARCGEVEPCGRAHGAARNG